MKNLGKLWTGAVAYVSLLVGAGLSVAGNLADTDRVRGNLVDAVDIVLAVGPPLATLLVAELFVSEWPRRLSVQSVRWVTTAVVGTLATVVSWLHIHELLMARGQLALVSVLWPIAIDGLAIMAMAKLLVVRMSHVPLDTDADTGSRTPGQRTRDMLQEEPDIRAALRGDSLSTDADTDIPAQDMSQADTDIPVSPADVPAMSAPVSPADVPDMSAPVDTYDVPAIVPSAEEMDAWFEGTELVSAPVVGPAMDKDTRQPVRQPGLSDALNVAVAAILLDRELTPADKAHLAANHGVTTKTVGRRAAALKLAK